MKSRGPDRLVPPRLRSPTVLLVTFFVIVFILAPHRALPQVAQDAAAAARDIVPGASLVASDKAQPHAVSAGAPPDAIPQAPAKPPQQPVSAADQSQLPVRAAKPWLARPPGTSPKGIVVQGFPGQTQRHGGAGGAPPVAPAAGAVRPAAAEKCLKYILYDKPVKTGSTAVTKALKVYLGSRGESYFHCNFEECTEAARDMCAGRTPKQNIVEHMRGQVGLINCLGRLGYYKVTSIRHPLERWESSFLFNQKKNGTHYGIHHGESYQHFMENYPRCALHHYYDGLGRHCETSSVTPEERAAEIVARYDEIIDLYNDDAVGQLHGRLRQLLREENKSPRPDTNFREPFDKSRLDVEMNLYNALKKRQKELQSKEPLLC